MGDGSGKAREIDLGEDFGDVVVKANGAQVKIGADGSIRGFPAAANDTAAKSKAAPQIGDLDGGGVYVGKSATTGKALHAALADEPEYLTFDEAFAAAEKMRRQPGRENAHVPTAEELNVNLFKNRNTGNLKDTFNTSGSGPGSCYRSSAPDCDDGARVQWFDDGIEGYDLRYNRLPVRLVW